ncbi:MAG: ABC transporter permease [Trueperaceae bacterium]
MLRHPWRSTATVLGVAIGIAAVLATLSVGANVRANLQADLQAAVGRAGLLITPGAEGRAVMEAAPLLDAVQGTPGIDAFVPVFHERLEPLRQIEAFERSMVPGVDSGFQVAGRPMDRPELLPASLVQGRWPQGGADEVVLTDVFAAGRDLEVGDAVEFASRFGTLSFELVGLMDAGEGYASTNGARVAIVPLDALQRALRLEGRITFVEVLLEDGATNPQVRDALESRLDDRHAVASPAGSGDVAGGVVQTLQSGLLVLSVSLLALGGFMAYNTFMAAVVERTRDYALLRTIALRRRDVRRLAMAEAAWIGSFGAVAGIGLGYGLSWLLTTLNAIGLGFEVRTVVMPAWSLLAATGAGLVVALGAGLLPALEASRASPLAARRGADAVSAPARTGIGWLLIGAAVVCTQLPWVGRWALFGGGLATMTFVAGTALAARSLLRPALVLARPLLHRTLGVAGRLGASFTERNASRNGVAIGTVIVGTGLVIGVGSMIGGIDEEIRTWIDTTIVGDLFVTSPVSFPEDFEARATQVPGVDQASGVGLNIVRFQPQDAQSARSGRSVALILVDSARFDPESGFGRFQYLQGQGDDVAGHAALMDPDAVLIASTLRERFGLGVGDTIDLRTSDGFASFRVGGVVVDFTGGGETVVTSIEQMDRFGGGTADLYVLTVHDGVDPVQVATDLRATFPDLYLDATPNDAYRQRILDVSERSFRTTDTLLVLAVLIAALGVANTLGMNLTGRARELALLRTLGLTRGALRRVVMAEGIVVVIVGSALGVAFGVLLADVVTRGASALTGYQIPARVPWDLVALALIASPAVGLIASWLPARRAARLAPIEAMRGSE